ncbi:MAG TPA: hypothetical protein VFO77_08880 [Actinoplanes sp.]|nr:hypothetical protein [Actinoplanes sp.]
MAQLQGTYKDEAAARRAVERLRAMDIPDEDIVLSREGKDADGYYLLSAEIPDGQFSAAQAIVNAPAAGATANPAGATSADLTAPADVAREDLTEEAGGGAIGAVAGGLAGAAVAGPVGAVTGAALGAAGGAAAGDALDDDTDNATVYSGRSRPGTAGEVLGTRTDEGATADPDVAAMAGPGVIGHGALGGPAALTARAAAVGSAEELLEENRDNDNPDVQGDNINSVSPR